METHWPAGAKIRCQPCHTAFLTCNLRSRREVSATTPKNEVRQQHSDWKNTFCSFWDLKPLYGTQGTLNGGTERVKEIWPGNVPKVVRLGDFNFADISWSDPPVAHSSEGTRFISLCEDLNLTKLVTKPTHATPTSSTVLELILATTPDTSSPVTSSSLSGLSDHCIQQFTFSIKFPHKGQTAKTIRDYAGGDFAAINAELEVFRNSFTCSCENLTVEDNWNAFKIKAL